MHIGDLAPELSVLLTAVAVLLAAMALPQRLHGWCAVVAIAGLAVAGLAACIAVVQLHAGGYLSIWWLLLSLALIGAAQGSVVSPNQTLTLASVPLQYAGSSGAIMQTGQRIGTSIGIAVITAAVFASLNVFSWPIAVSLGFGLTIIVVLGALGVAFKDLRDRANDHQRR